MINIVTTLKLYNQELERVKLFLWFDEGTAWTVHIHKVLDKGRKVLNVLRCVVGNEWGGQTEQL